MYYLAECEDGNTFQVFYEDNSLNVVAYGDTGLRPFKVKEIVEKGETLWLAPGVPYRVGPETVHYLILYLDVFGLVQKTLIKSLTPGN